METETETARAEPLSPQQQPKPALRLNWRRATLRVAAFSAATLTILRVGMFAVKIATKLPAIATAATSIAAAADWAGYPTLELWIDGSVENAIDVALHILEALR